MSLHAKRIKTKSSYIGGDIIKDINILLDKDTSKDDDDTAEEVTAFTQKVVSIERRYIELMKKIHPLVGMEKSIGLAVPYLPRGSTRPYQIQHLKSIRFLLHKLNTHDAYKELCKRYRKQYEDK